MDRFWLLTWTTYGSWLPGDQRGFVGETRTPDWEKIIHNAPGTPCDSDLPALRAFCRAAMKGPPILLSTSQAPLLLAQFQETARFRGWSLLALAIMANHVHLVVGVLDDPEPAYLLQSFKSYASRKLNQHFARPANGTWWTESGSRRRLPNERAVADAVSYVERQECPLLIWSVNHPTGRAGDVSPPVLTPGD